LELRAIGIFGLASSSYLNKADNVSSIKLDGEGNLYIVGATYSALGGPNGGYSLADIFIIKFNQNSGILDANFGEATDDDGVLHINNDNSANASSNGDRW
jgi:hypothetical protein